MIGGNIFAVGVLLGGCTLMEKIWKPETPGSCISPTVFNYVGRIQSGMFKLLDALGKLSAELVARLERFYRSHNRSISLVHGMEAHPQAKYEIWSYLSHVRRLIVKATWGHSRYLC